MITTTHTENGLTVSESTQSDEHEGHATEWSETLHDNPIEYTRHGWCHDCHKSYWIMSVTIEHIEPPPPCESHDWIEGSAGISRYCWECGAYEEVK